MTEQQAQQANTTKRGRPPTQQAGSPQTTASSGNATRHKRSLTLGDRVKAMESRNGRLIRLADQIKQIARGG